jgi:hypothetical protein
MADKKISALTASTTPLAGTEVLPIVQSGATVKVSIADVTAGRAVSASSITASTENFIVSTSGKGLTTGSAIPLGLGVNNTLTAMTIDTAGKIGIGNSSPSYTLDVLEGGAGGATVNPIRVFCAAGGASTARIMFGSAANTESGAIGAQTTAGDAGDLTFDTDTAGSLTEKMRISSVGNATLTVGNLVIGTAGKGIDFSAATHAAGMTSELLNDYEEGTWTPADASGAGLSFTLNATSYYTKIGNVVTCNLDVTYPATADASVARITLPFTPKVSGAGGNIGYTTKAGGIYVSLSSAGSFTFTDLVSNFLTNANMSTTRSQISFSYIAA